jgi:hypothetical protein
MKRSDSKRISYLYTALLIAGVLANLCAAPAVARGRFAAQSRQDFGLFSNAANGSQPLALTNALRPHSQVPASKQKRVRHPALDFAALPPERFHLSVATVAHRGIDRNRLIFHSSILVLPRGRAPPVSV